QRPVATTSKTQQQALLDSGRTAFENGQYDEALRLFNRVIASAAREPKVASQGHLKVGSVYMAQRKFAPALASFQQAIMLDANNAEAFNNLGEAQGELRQYERALQSFNRAVALDPNLLRARYNLGITYNRMRSFQYSEFVFRILVRDHPTYDL